MSTDTDENEIEQCEEMFCDDGADVALINEQTDEERVYCLKHAEEADDTIDHLLVGGSVNTGQPTI